MSSQPETERAEAETGTMPPRLGGPSRLGNRAVGSVDLDLIACDGCGRRFAARDGREMIAAIKGPCPGCGGRFQLLA